MKIPILKILKELRTREVFVILFYQASKGPLNAFVFSFLSPGNFFMSVHSESSMSAMPNLRYPQSEFFYTDKNFLHDFFVLYVALRKWKRHNITWKTAEQCASDLP